MSDCIFCKIIDGDIPCAKVYEDEHVLAFLDISQVTKGHTLVIPKIHKENIYDMTPEVSNHYFQAIPKIARAIKQEFEPPGLKPPEQQRRKSRTICVPLPHAYHSALRQRRWLWCRMEITSRPIHVRGFKEISSHPLSRLTSS